MQAYYYLLLERSFRLILIVDEMMHWNKIDINSIKLEIDTNRPLEMQKYRHSTLGVLNVWTCYVFDLIYQIFSKNMLAIGYGIVFYFMAHT